MYFRVDVLRSTTTNPLGVALEKIERRDEIAVQDLAGLVVDQRHGERLLHRDDLAPRMELPANPPGELEQALLRLLLDVPDRLMLGLQIPGGLEVHLDVLDARPPITGST